MYQRFGEEDWFQDENAYHKYMNVQGTPYLKLQGANWDVKLGANVNFLFDTKVAFSLAPNIEANIRINDVNKFYAEIGGGVNNNTLPRNSSGKPLCKSCEPCGIFKDPL